MSNSPLAGIQRFQSGIGDGDDLRLSLKEDLNGGWFAALRAGFYYSGAAEGYLFAQKAYRVETVAATGAIATREISGLDADPTALGPVQMRARESGLPLVRLCSPLRTYQTLSFTTSGDVSEASVSGFVVSVLSHPASGVYLPVPTLADVLSTEDYVYDPQAGTLQIQDPDPPTVYANWLVPESDPEQLRQWEIVKVDRDGKVRTQYTNVSMVSGLTPVIRKATPSGAVDVTPTAAAGNVLTLPEDSGLEVDDLVSVAYYVQGSFSAGYDRETGTLQIRYLAAETGDHLVEWEGGASPYYDTGTLPVSHVNRIQLNPLLERQEPGFLYLCPADTPSPLPARVDLFPSRQNLVWGAHHPETCLFRVLVRDSEGHRVPRCLVTLTATLSGAALTAQTAETDWHGKALFLLTPNQAGPLVLTAVAGEGGESASGSLELTVHARETTEAAAEQELGKLLLHLEETPFKDALYRLNAHYVHVDGAPYQPDDAAARTQAWGGLVQFRSGKSVLYTLDGKKLGPSGSVALNADSIASVLVEPVPGDVLRAEVRTPTVDRRRMARPVRVLHRPSPDAALDSDFGSD